MEEGAGRPTADPIAEAAPRPSAPGPVGGSWPARLLVPAALAGVVFAQARMFRESTCETFDEFTYLWMGMSVFRLGNFLNLDSPMTPPLPILLEYWLPAIMAGVLPDEPGWMEQVPALIRQARFLTSITVGIPLAWVVQAWLTRRRGWKVGALGGGLVATSPTVLASASVATTDACFALFAVVALAAFIRYRDRPSRASFLVAGAAMGLALASKQTAVVLFAVALAEWLTHAPPRRPGWTRIDASLRLAWWAGSRLAGLVAIAFGVDWALYGFGLGPPFGAHGGHANLPIIVPMVANLFPDPEAIMAVARKLRPPLAIDTFLGMLEHASTGHYAFLMGMHSYRGWWYFFPVAIALKSTPAELVLFGLAAALATRRRTWSDPTRRLWLGTLLVLIGSGMCSSINIGQRYMLLAYPLAILLGMDAIGGLRPTRAALVGGLLLAWQATSAIGIAPHYLSYFNRFCGGPSEGYRYLVDSSLDWGQDLPSLRRELEARRYAKVAMAYFGTASPRVYGLRWMNHTDVEGPAASGCDWLAISATALQGAYGGRATLLESFGRLPSIRVGYTIFLYDLKDPRVRAALDGVRGRATSR